MSGTILALQSCASCARGIPYVLYIKSSGSNSTWAVIVKVPVASVNKIMRPSPSCFEFRLGQFYWDSGKPPVLVASFLFADSNVPCVVPSPPGKVPVVAPGSLYPVRHDVALG